VEPHLDRPALYIKQEAPSRDVAGIAIGYPGMRLTDVDDVVSMTVLDTIVSGYSYPSGWLFDSLRGGSHSLVYEVHAMNRSALLPGVFQIYAACQPAQVTEVYRIINQQMDRARAGEFTAEELERAKAVIVTSVMMETQTSSARATQAALDEVYGLGFDYHDHFAERIGKVTLEGVRAAARRYLSSPPVIVVVTPAPGDVRLGFDPQAIDRDQPADQPGGRGAE
jgi:zinc protease